MRTYIALHHQAHRRVASAPLGVFSDQDKAKAACQRIEDADDRDAPGDAKRNRSGNLLHIETDGCIVNIQVGLHDVDGRQVTSVRILPDNYAERGGRWVQDGSRIVQLLDGETRLPVHVSGPAGQVR